MKIRGPGQVTTNKATGTKRKSGTSDAAFSEKVSAPESKSGAASTQQASPVAAIDAVLSLQETETATDGRSRGVKRAEEMLEVLEEVRRGILLGVIPQSKLKALSNLARTQREQFTDPRLAEILNDIELRAEVEIAKFERNK